PYVERLIGSIRRECLDHIIIFNEHHLRAVLSRYFQYHHKTRTHLSLNKDCPETRPIHPPTAGKIIAFPEVGGLHHRYERRAAWLTRFGLDRGSNNCHAQTEYGDDADNCEDRTVIVQGRSFGAACVHMMRPMCRSPS